MYCYKYNPTTYEYTETVLAPLDPEATKQQGKDVFSLPIYATFKRPPQLIKFKTAIYVHNTDTWQTVDDYRGEYIVNSDMNVSIMNEIGPLPDGFINITPEEAATIQQDPIYYIIDNGQLVPNPDYEEIKRQQEAARIAMLSMTKYDFFKVVCQPNNLGYQQVMALINSSDDIAAAWNFCERVYRGDELLNRYIKQYIPSLTDAQLDELFIQYGK